MRLVLQLDDAATSVVVAYDAGEADDRARRTISDGALVRREVQRIGGDRNDQGRSPSSSGSGTSDASSPARPVVPGGTTANPTDWASPRSIDEPACPTGCTNPASSRRTSA